MEQEGSDQGRGERRERARESEKGAWEGGGEAQRTRWTRGRKPCPDSIPEPL